MFRTALKVICLALSAACAGAAVGAEPEFIGLGDLPGGTRASSALDVSADGRVVVGHSLSASGTEAYRWADGAMTALGDLPGGSAHSVASACSRDGSVVVGSGHGASGRRAFRWQDGALAALPDPAGAVTQTQALDVTDDGATVVGDALTADGRLGTVWTPDGPYTIDRGASSLTGVSGGGAVLAGSVTNRRGTHVLLLRDGEPHASPALRGVSFAGARAVSRDGSVVVGAFDSMWGHEAFRWGPSGLEPLGGFSDHHDFFSVAHDVSADGAVVVGASENAAEVIEAFIWTERFGLRPLRDVLAVELGLDLSGWSLTEATAVSDDGMTIVGNGVNPLGQAEAWLARLAPIERAERPEFLGVIDALADPASVHIDETGILHVADAGNDRVVAFDLDGNRVALYFQGLSAPRGVVAEGAVVWILDTGHDRVIAMNASNQILHSFGGFGDQPGRLNRPEGIAVHEGDVYIADTGNRRVQVFTTETPGVPLAVMGAGRLLRPTGVAVDDDGLVYVVDADADRVFVFEPGGEPLGEFGRRGTLPGLFSSPRGITWRDGLLYVADTGNHRVQVFEPPGELVATWGRRVLRPREAGGRLLYPAGVGIAPDGSFAAVIEPFEDRLQLFALPTDSRGIGPLSTAGPGLLGPALDFADGLMTVARPDGHAVEVMDLGNEPPRTLMWLGGYGTRSGEMIRPAGIAFDGATLFVSDAGNRRIQLYGVAPDGVRHDPPPPESVQLIQSVDLGARGAVPGALALDPGSRLFVVDSAGRRIMVFAPGFELAGLFGQPLLRDPVDIAVGVSQVYVADALRGVFVFDLDGQHLATWDGFGTVSAVAYDPAGFIYVADEAAHRIIKMDRRGETVTWWGSKGLGAGELYKPAGLAFDEGRLIVLERGNHRAQVLLRNGRSVGVFGAALYCRPARMELSRP